MYNTVKQDLIKSKMGENGKYCPPLAGWGWFAGVRKSFGNLNVDFNFM